VAALSSVSVLLLEERRHWLADLNALMFAAWAACQPYLIPLMANKIILITGVTRGLGRAMLEEFVRQGHIVLGCGRSPKGIGQLRRQVGPPHDLSVVDVASDEAVKAWADRLLGSYGPPDLVLNNAGLINRNARLWAVSALEFSAVIDVNIKGIANVIRHFVPEMVNRRRGVIVNFSSGWGRSADAEVAPYCATKWAVEGLTQAFAQELPAGMAAVSLNPGIINTDMLRSCFGGSASGYPSPAEWVRGVVPFLLDLGPGDNGKQLTAPNASNA
jgi:NAD(P)-dependent dehydrogenase (short-subunit alcohol dehydrogenase family)